MQALLQEPTPPFPKPNCLVWYAGDPCDVLIQRYNQAAEQRQLVDWRLSVTLPLQRQIADQKQQIADQQSQIRALEARVASQSREALLSEANNQALFDGIGAGVGVGLAFVVAVAAFRRLARNTVAPTRPTGLESASESPGVVFR